MRKDYINKILLVQEQLYLKSTIFSNTLPLSNFTIAYYSAFDRVVKLYYEAYKEYLRSSSPTKQNREEPKALPFANSISFRVKGLSLSKVRANSNLAIPLLAIKIKYSKGLGPNKRTREDKPS